MNIAWAAGLFEGEGCITLTGRGDRRYALMALGSTDRDVVSKFFDSIGRVGTLYTSPRKPKLPHHKPLWEWRMQGYDDVADLCAKFMPFLGVRRRLRIQEVLEEAGASLSKFPKQRRRSVRNIPADIYDVAEIVSGVLDSSGRHDLAALVRAEPRAIKYALGFE